MKTCLKNQKFSSFSLSETDYFSQSASGYPVCEFMEFLILRVTLMFNIYFIQCTMYIAARKFLIGEPVHGLKTCTLQVDLTVCNSCVLMQSYPEKSKKKPLFLLLWKSMQEIGIRFCRIYCDFLFLLRESDSLIQVLEPPQPVCSCSRSKIQLRKNAFKCMTFYDGHKSFVILLLE